MSLRSASPPASLVSRFWLPVAAYVALIAVVSHQPNLHPPVPFFFFVEIDKVAHVVEYGLLGLLLARAWRATLPATPALSRGLVAIGCGMALGGIDEVHQSFVRGRDSSLWDLAADTAGVTLAQLVYHLRVRS